MHRITAAVLAAFLAGCSSMTVGGGDATATLNGDIDRDSTSEFDVVIEQQPTSTLLPQTEHQDVRYTFLVTNRTEKPVKVKRIELQSMGSGSGSEMPVSARKYDVAIAPREKASIDFWATVYIHDTRLPMLPGIVRAAIEFESDGGKRRETFVRNMGGRGSVGIAP